MPRRKATYLGILLAAATLRSTTALALTACTAEEIVAQDPGCPAGDGICAITASFDTGDDDFCIFDFGSRDVILRGKLQGGLIELDTGALTIEPGGVLRGGYLFVLSDDVWIQRQDRYVRGLLDASGEDHYISIWSDGDLRIDGELSADATTVNPDRYGIELNASGSILASSASVISGNGVPDYDGFLSILATGPVTLDGTISMLAPGSDPFAEVTSEESSVSIGGRVRLDGWYGTLPGAELDVSARTGVVVSGKVTTTAGPTTIGSEYTPYSGGVFITTTSGDAVVSGELVTDGVLYGTAGSIGISSDLGNVLVSGRLSARSHRIHEEVASIDLRAAKKVTFTGSLDIANGGVIHPYGKEIDLGGKIVGHTLAGADFSEATSGISTQFVKYVRLSGLIDFGATGCENNVCVEPWSIEVEAGTLEVAPEAQIFNQGRLGGGISFKAQNLVMAGSIKTIGDSGNGIVELNAAVACSITGAVLPAPLLGGACSPSFTPPPTATSTPTISGAPTATMTPSPAATSTQTATIPAGSPTASPVPCFGDCDASGTLDGFDLVRVMDVLHLCPGSLDDCEAISPEQSCPAADFNHDGHITAADLARLTAAMSQGGNCP